MPTRAECGGGDRLEDTFEFSQAYTFFWDKLEKANYFLVAMVSLADKEPLDGRLVQHLLKDPLCDGGQWDMFVNVVQKYGLVPKGAYRESWSSSNSRRMNWLLTHKLRGWASEIRDAAPEARAGMKQGFLDEFLGILLVSLGTPPRVFDWRYVDTDGGAHVVPGLTPLSFLNDHVRKAGFDFGEWISLIHDPRNELGQAYTVQYLGNVLGAAEENVRYINVSIDQLRQYTRQQLDRGQAVWFGCDVGKHFDRTMAVMDTELFDYELVYGTKPTLGKEARLRYGDSLMTHAMVFTGYDHDAEGGVTKWRVENSWGDGSKQGAPGGGDEYGLPAGKGYYLMTDAWFNEYMYQIIVKKGDLEDGLKPLLTSKPVELPAWDPMGALAAPGGH